MEIPDYLTCLLRNLYADQEVLVRIIHGKLDWLQIGKGVYIKAVYCHPAYLTYMQRTSWEMPGWMKLKLDLEKAEEPEINCQHMLDYQKSKRAPEKHLLLLY